MQMQCRLYVLWKLDMVSVLGVSIAGDPIMQYSYTHRLTQTGDMEGATDTSVDQKSGEKLNGLG
jgi:hypothetical protein